MIVHITCALCFRSIDTELPEDEFDPSVLVACDKCHKKVEKIVFMDEFWQANSKTYTVECMVCKIPARTSVEEGSSPHTRSRIAMTTAIDHGWGCSLSTQHGMLLCCNACKTKVWADVRRGTPIRDEYLHLCVPWDEEDIPTPID